MQSACIMVQGGCSMKQKYGLLIATWILWFASILIPLLYSALKSIPRRWMTLLLLVTMLLVAVSLPASMISPTKFMLMVKDWGLA